MSSRSLELSRRRVAAISFLANIQTEQEMAGEACDEQDDDEDDDRDKENAARRRHHHHHHEHHHHVGITEIRLDVLQVGEQLPKQTTLAESAERCSLIY